MSRRRTTADFLRRLFAGGAAAVVFALTLFAASPALNDELHGATATTHDESCAVVLFAHGVSLPLDPVAAPLPPVALVATAPAAPREIFVSSPRYLRHPERGPPLSLVS